jgi:hypothetical protein
LTKTFPQKEKKRKEKKRKKGWLTIKELEKGGFWEFGRRREKGQGTHTNLAPTSHGIVGAYSPILDPHLNT